MKPLFGTWNWAAVLGEAVLGGAVFGGTTVLHSPPQGEGLFPIVEGIVSKEERLWSQIWKFLSITNTNIYS